MASPSPPTPRLPPLTSCRPTTPLGRRCNCPLEAERSINHKKNEIGDFANVDHRNVSCRNFPLTAVTGSLVRYRLLGVPADQRLDESTLPDAWWANDSDYDGWRDAIDRTIDKRDVQTTSIFFCSTSTLSFRSTPTTLPLPQYCDDDGHGNGNSCDHNREVTWTTTTVTKWS